MVSRCEGGGALFRVSLCLIKSYYALGVCRLIQIMAVDPILPFVATGRLVEIDLEAMADQDWLSYSYEDGRIMVLPEQLPLVRCSASGAKVHEGGRLEIRPKYREKIAHRGMSTEYAGLMWRRYLGDGTNLKTIPTLEEQDALNGPASPTTNAATADVVSPVQRVPSSPVVVQDENP